jgi:predicted phosphodiesterase
MKIMMISDLHYSTKIFHGRNESKVFNWLYNIIEKEKPDLLLCAGDFGKEVTLEMFQPIINQTYLLTIYGNHENIELIKNIKNKDGSYCWLQDGIIREYDRLKIAGINGNIAMKKKKNLS